MVNRQLQSTLRPNGDVELRVAEVPMPQPEEDEIVVEVQAAPLNPTDLALMLALADPTTARRSTREDESVTTLRTSEAAAAALRSRWDTPTPVGVEGAGRVVSAGTAKAAQALLERSVAIWGGGTYTRYRKVRAADAMLLPDDVSAAQGAGAFVNPLTVVGMVETMRDEGFTALVHTAAASTVGQMLCRLCREEGVGLVNVVRRPEQVELLRSVGAEHICDISTPSFEEDLVQALRSTGATVAFDAIGGGQLAGRILRAMETVAASAAEGYQQYGSDVRKKVYVYGSLDRSPVELLRNWGLAWEIGGWLLFHFLQRAGTDRVEDYKRQVAAGLQTTFAMSYGHTVSLDEVCDPEVLTRVTQLATGDKFLIDLAR